jgi:ferric-dicitrate binding protein FerR (iron transport regulator)
MIDPRDIDFDLVGRYVTGAASPAERRALEQWMTADRARHQLVAHLEEVWRQAGALDHPALDATIDVDAKWHALEQAIHPTRVFRFPAQSSRAAPRRWIYRAAAALVLATAAGALWKAGVNWRAPRPAAALAMREYVTPRGLRAQLRLPDGTGVMLNMGSRLRVTADYGERDRQIELVGEALFSVTHDGSKPFTVRTPRAVAVDLGTRFLVRAYADDPLTDIFVVEGQVAVQATDSGPPGASDDSLILNSGERARVVGHEAVRLSRKVSLDEYLDWTEGKLRFRGTPLRDAVRRLERWFDIQIVLAPASLGDRPIVATVENELATDVLATIAASLDVRLSRAGRTFTLTAD